jgi:hypothetical protein
MSRTSRTLRSRTLRFVVAITVSGAVLASTIGTLTADAQLEAVTDEDAEPLIPSPGTRFFHQPRLADPRLARQQHDARLTRLDPSEGIEQQAQLAVARHEDRADQRRRHDSTLPRSKRPLLGPMPERGP